MSKLMKSSVAILKRNWSTLLWFEILYRTVSFLVLYPARNSLLSFALKAAGTTYISQENIFLLFKNPLSILCLLLLLLLFFFFVFFELTAFILCFEASWHGTVISLTGLVGQTLKQSIEMFHDQGLLLYLGLIPLFSISFFRISSSMLTSFKIPEFILDFIRSNTLLFAVFSFFLLVNNIYIFFFLFGLPEAILNRSGIRGVFSSGRMLLKDRKHKPLCTFLICLGGMTVLVILVIVLFILMLWAYSHLFFPLEQARYIFRNALIAWEKIGKVLLEIFYTAVILVIIIVQYHTYKGDEIAPLKVDKSRPQYMFKKLGAAFLAFLLLSVYSESEIAGNLMQVPNPATEIVAHRAGAAFGPENTIAALDNAVCSGANWAEIDVQQTRDGVLIILHDSNFKRTTGYNSNVWNTDYATVKTLDAGSYFSSGYAGEKIPTLEEMLVSAKNRINLMIELKYTGHEKKLVTQTLKLIRSHHMEEQCMIASMNMDILQEVKTQAPSMRTAYITAILMTDNYDLENIDSYSVETTNLSYSMVAQAHMQRKRVYAWTANSESTIKKTLQSRADGLITDNVCLARYYLENTGELSLINFLVDLCYPINSE